MSDSIFGDLDVEAAADDPFSVEDGTHEVVITKAEVKRDKKDTANYLVLTYTLQDGTKRSVQEWKKIPQASDEDADRAASFLKQRLLSIGIPADRINSFVPDDALGTEVVITVKDNNGFPNVQRVALPDDGSSSADAGNAFANLT